MNATLRIATALLFLSPASFAGTPPAAGPLLKITGTITRVVPVSSTATRLRFEKLDDKRLFEEFGVSREDYAFALADGGFNLVAKSQSSGLPTLPVFTLGLEKDLIQTKPFKARIGGPVESAATGNIFEGLAGETTAATGAVIEGGTITALKNLVLRIYARGSDQSAADPTSPGVLLRFTVKQIGQFEQKP
jgi:hypothetical protein